MIIMRERLEGGGGGGGGRKKKNVATICLFVSQFFTFGFKLSSNTLSLVRRKPVWEEKDCKINTTCAIRLPPPQPPSSYGKCCLECEQPAQLFHARTSQLPVHQPPTTQQSASSLWWRNMEYTAIKYVHAFQPMEACQIPGYPEYW